MAIKRGIYTGVKWTARIALVGMVLAGVLITVAAVNLADGITARLPFRFYSRNLVISILADEVYRAEHGMSLIQCESIFGRWKCPYQISEDNAVLLSGWSPVRLEDIPQDAVLDAKTAAALSGLPLDSLAIVSMPGLTTTKPALTGLSIW